MTLQKAPEGIDPCVTRSGGKRALDTARLSADATGRLAGISRVERETLILFRSEVSPHNRIKPPDEVGSHMRSVLVIDKNPEIAGRLRLMFRGWRLKTATSIADAMQCLRDDAFDLIMLDDRIGDADMLSILAYLKQNFPAMVVFGINGSPIHNEELAASAAQTTFLKPVGRDEVLEVLRRVFPDTAHPSPPAAPLSSSNREIHLVEGATIADLNLAAVTKHTRSLPQAPTPLDYLHSRRLIIEDQPTTAGILLFGHEPARFLPQCAIDLVVIADLSAITTRSVENIYGTLPEIIERATTWLRITTERTMTLALNRRADRAPIPYVVIRELTINAICHRDWSSPQTVQVIVRHDRATWTSPGRLPDTITSASIPQRTYPRNPFLARVFSEMGLIEKLGLGWPRVVAALRANGNAPANLTVTDDSVTVDVYALSAPPLDPKNQTARAQGETIRAVIAGFKGRSWMMRELVQALIDAGIGINERTLLRNVNSLVDRGDIVVTGAKRNRRYQAR